MFSDCRSNGTKRKNARSFYPPSTLSFWYSLQSFCLRIQVRNQCRKYDCFVVLFSIIYWSTLSFWHLLQSVCLRTRTFIQKINAENTTVLHSILFSIISENSTTRLDKWMSWFWFAGERISLTITILLAMTVFMLVVAETIPPSSDVVPLIAKFYMAGMCEMAVGLVWTCYILKYYHSDVIEMPSWVRKYVLGYLGNFFGISMENLKRIQEHSNLRKGSGRKATFHTTLEPLCSSSRTIQIKNKLRVVNGHNNNPYDSHYRHISQTTSNGFLPPSLNASEISLNQQDGFQDPVLLLGERILDRVDTLVENSVVDDRINNHKEEWRIAAMVMDKLSLWVFGIAVLATVLACFLQAPGYVPWLRKSPRAALHAQSDRGD